MLFRRRDHDSGKARSEAQHLKLFFRTWEGIWILEKAQTLNLIAEQRCFKAANHMALSFVKLALATTLSDALAEIGLALA